ncbi:uncharacterized protein LOC110733942 [Chenopodium quinoa]|uniref:uncharacterized protein LOC110733942 n=1 Tax=Chenopodium quinoa TaxID=63459 RepID=UPI000B77BE4E|nr:uncharacterized protein LOC110733942 [Chenopodium quinoa]
MARTMQTATYPDYRSEGSDDQTPERETSGQRDQTALERSPPRAPSTPADSFLEECDQGGDEAISAPLAQDEEETESDSSASTSESSDDLPPLEDSEEEERKKWKEKDDPFNIHVSAKDRLQKGENLNNFTQMHPLGDGYRIRVPPEFISVCKEALNMLPTEKTPQRSSVLIRKQLAEKAAAEVKAKGGEVGKTLEKQLKRAREETPSVLNKSKKSTSASTPGASAGNQQLRIEGRIERLEADLETAKQQASDAETAQKKAEEARKKADEGAKKADEALKKAQTDHGTLQGVSEENTKLKTKIAWAALYPNADYGVWALAHSYAEYVVYLRDRGEPEPDSFEACVNSNNEPSAPQLPGPGEAQDIPSDDEDQEAPSAGKK